MRRVSSWLAHRPFLASLLVVVIVAVPGYWRVDVIATDGHKTASEVAALVKRIEQADTIRRLNGCRDRNTAQRSTRRTFDALFDRLAQLGANPNVLAELRDSLPRAPKVDRDCTDDQKLTDADYTD